MNAVAVELSVEELHFLAAAHDLAAVPGLGALPGDGRMLDLLAGTAARSLVGRGLGIYSGSGEFLIATELLPLLDVFADPDWVISATRVGAGERGLRTWTARGSEVTGLVQLAAGAYGLVGMAPQDVVDEVAAFLELGGDDEGDGEPVALDESRVAFLAEARRVVRAGEGVEGVALEWADPGSGSRVGVLAGETDDERVMVVPTGRRRVLLQLAGLL